MALLCLLLVLILSFKNIKIIIRHFRINLVVTFFVFLFFTNKYTDFFQGKADNEYLPILITTFAEIPGLLLAAIPINYIGRRRTQALLFFGCAFFASMLIIPSSLIVATLFAMGARCCIYGAFSVTYVYTPEVHLY